MGQRINIQYSIDVEELPENVSRLLVDAIGRLHEASTDTTFLPSTKPNEVLTLETLSRVDKMRECLSSIDYMLSDVSNLINSFINYKTQMQHQEDAATTAQTQADVTPPQDDSLPEHELEELQKKIEVFRQTLSEEQPALEDENAR